MSLIFKVLIYTLSDPITKEIRYVGKTKSPLKVRYNSHIAKSKRKETHTHCWIQSLIKQKLKPLCEVLEECDQDTWENSEIYWISQLKTWGFNLTNHTEGGEGGGPRKGWVMPQITKDKISKTMKGRQNNKVVFTKKVKLKMSQPVLKLSLTGEILENFDSVKEAAKSMNLSSSSISRCIQNPNYTSGEYKWIKTKVICQ